MTEPSRDQIHGVDANEPNTRLLRVKVLRAVDLQRRDFLGSTGDPYVKVSLQNRDNRNQVVDITRTRTVLKTLNPQWNQDFIFRAC
jgi:Ca2+-dependent lipid-binding protein